MFFNDLSWYGNKRENLQISSKIVNPLAFDRTVCRDFSSLSRSYHPPTAALQPCISNASTVSVYKGTTEPSREQLDGSQSSAQSQHLKIRHVYRTT
jgi:hypothetical protein